MHTTQQPEGSCVALHYRVDVVQGPAKNFDDSFTFCRPTPGQTAGMTAFRWLGHDYVRQPGPPPPAPLPDMRSRPPWSATDEPSRQKVIPYRRLGDLWELDAGHPLAATWAHGIVLAGGGYGVLATFPLAADDAGPEEDVVLAGWRAIPDGVTTAVVGSGEVVVAGTTTRQLTAWNDTGRTLWQADAKGVPTRILIDGNRVVVGTREGTVTAFDLTSGRELWALEKMLLRVGGCDAELEETRAEISERVETLLEDIPDDGF